MDPATIAALASIGSKLIPQRGGDRTTQTVTQSSNTSIGFNPVIAVSVDAGTASGEPSGGASGSAAATSSGGGSADPWGVSPVNSMGDLPQATGGMFGGLLDDPLILVALAVGAFLLFGGLKRR